jgi:hypothetical protein
MSYSIDRSRLANLKKSTFGDRPPSSYKLYSDNYKNIATNIPTRTNIKPGGDAFGYNYSNELPSRTRDVMGNLGNLQTQTKLSEGIERKYTTDTKPKNQMIDNLEKLQNKIKGVLGQH